MIAFIKKIFKLILDWLKSIFNIFYENDSTDSFDWIFDSDDSYIR